MNRALPVGMSIAWSSLMRFVPLCIVALLIACPSGPDDGGSGPSGPYSSTLGDEPDFTEAPSLLQARSWLQWDQLSLQGAFHDGPPLRTHVETRREGNCRLVEFTPTTCSPNCATGELCIEGECLGFPERVDRGDATWTWPDGEQTISPDGVGSYWAQGEGSTEGDTTFAVDGLEMTTSVSFGVEPAGDWGELIDDRTGDVVLSWSTPHEDARVRLHMTDCTGSHGGLADAEIECEAPDTGELVVPGAFLDALDAGNWSRGECGSHGFERYRSAAAEGGTVRFEAIAATDFFYRPNWNRGGPE